MRLQAPRLDPRQADRRINEAIAFTKARIAKAQAQAQAYRDVVTWAEANFLVENDDGQGELVRLERHQKAILGYVFKRGPDGRYPFSTVVYSTTKKNGKTAVAGMVARWAAETWGRTGEIYALANDFDQAQSRVFKAVAQSIELHPDFDPRRRMVRGEWRIQDKVLEHIPSGSTIKALASDYKGEAGANPSLTLFTELWGYVHEASRRLWTEMTPSPARPVSIRWVETYAGYENESELLEQLYKLGKAGRQLTAGELGDLDAFREAPNHDSLVPVWVNEAAGVCMYWDSGPIAHRMPWLRGEAGAQYYAEQSKTLTPNEFRRVHLNEWVGSESEAFPIEWWDACLDKLELTPGGKVPVVIAVDASVSGDCTALSMVARHPKEANHVVELFTRIWYPPPGGKMDYTATITEEVDRLVAAYNVVEVAYDEYQLHHWANEQRQKPKTAWYRAFPQTTDRLIADKQLYDMIRDRRLHHGGNPELRRHAQNVAAKTADQDDKLRFVKKNENARIDGMVALSMSAAECLRLAL